MSSVDVTHLLTWDEQSLARHGVEAVSARLEKRDDDDGEGVFWHLTTSLRRTDGTTPALLAVQLRLLDADGTELSSDRESLRTGIGRSAGLATGRLTAYSPDEQADCVCDAVASVRPGGPHHSEEPLRVPVTANADLLAAAGMTLDAARATCTTDVWSAEIHTTVAVRVTLDPAAPTPDPWAGDTSELAVQVLDRDGLPMTGTRETFRLGQDPDFAGTWIAATTITVPEVPTRCVILPPSSNEFEKDTAAEGDVGGADVDATAAPGQG